MNGRLDWTEIVAASDLENSISINIRNFQGLISYSHILPITRAIFLISEAIYVYINLYMIPRLGNLQDIPN